MQLNATHMVNGVYRGVKDLIFNLNLLLILETKIDNMLFLMKQM